MGTPASSHSIEAFVCCLVSGRVPVRDSNQTAAQSCDQAAGLSCTGRASGTWSLRLRLLRVKRIAVQFVFLLLPLSVLGGGLLAAGALGVRNPHRSRLIW